MISRTSFLSRRARLNGGAAATASVLATAGAASAAAEQGRPGPSGPMDGTMVPLLGTAGGPPPYGGRLGIASALTAGGDTHLIGCGRGAVTQYLRAGVDMSSLRAAFLTRHRNHPPGQRHLRRVH